MDIRATDCAVIGGGDKAKGVDVLVERMISGVVGEPVERLGCEILHRFDRIGPRHVGKDGEVRLAAAHRDVELRGRHREEVLAACLMDGDHTLQRLPALTFIDKDVEVGVAGLGLLEVACVLKNKPAFLLPVIGERMDPVVFLAGRRDDLPLKIGKYGELRGFEDIVVLVGGEGICI